MLSAKKYFSYAQRGFSLMEIVFSLVLITLTITTLVSLLSLGIRSAGEGKDQSVQLLIARNVEAKLLIDENWPIPASQPLSASTGSFFKTNFWFDIQGKETASQDAIYLAELTFMPSQQVPYVSSRLDCVLLTLYPSSHTNQPLAYFTLQRAHLTPRSWNP